MHSLHLLLAIFSISFLSVQCQCPHAHGGHGHAHDPPANKYSQEANQPHHTHSHDAHSHDHHAHSHDAPTAVSRTREELQELWITALGSTVLISAAPFFILFFIPLDSGEEHRAFLNVLLAFAAGGLLGDAFLHLIPHAVPPPDASRHHGHSHDGDHHGHSHNTEYIWCNIWVLAGILTFLLIEKWARVMQIGHTHSHDGDDHAHSHEAKAKLSDSEESEDDEKEGGDKTDKKSDDKKSTKSEGEVEGWLPRMDISGYLNLAADFSHNFTDGLAIGASYLAGNTVGMITTFTILIHEVPHEIGDFAILIRSGCPRMKAIILQSTTAIGAMIGCAIGLSSEFLGKEAINVILPFTAGGFIYIACASILPELLQSKLTSFGQVCKEIIALFVGIGLMIIIGFFE